MSGAACAVLLADRSADRLGDGPLAFVVVGGRSLLSHAVTTLEGSRSVHGFVVVAPPGMDREVADTAEASAKFLAVTSGGSTPTGSLGRGVEAIRLSFDVVVVHDVSRPLATPRLIDAVVEALDGADVAVPLIPVVDTVKRVEDGIVRETVSRADLGEVQFPQAARRDLVSSGPDHRDVRPGERGSLLAGSMLGRAARLSAVPGDPANVMVSTPRDVRLAEALLAERMGGSVAR